MYRATRRNRNIGTAPQGHGQDNRLVIPDSRHDCLHYLERMTRYSVVKRMIRVKEYTFVVERTRADSCHSCTIDDIARMIGFVPEEDLEGLCLIVLRQPKRKEEILDPVWGRLLYDASIGGFRGPCIMFESVDMSRTLKFSRSQNPEREREIDSILGDHDVIDDRKDIVIRPTIENVRKTQLYMTLLHEVGHWVEYLGKAIRPAKNIDEEILLQEKYGKIPAAEKEARAHRYAEEKKKELIGKRLIPYARMLDAESMKNDGLRLKDFIQVKPPTP